MSDASPAGTALAGGSEPVGQPAIDDHGPDPESVREETVADKPARKSRPTLPGLVGGNNEPADPEIAKAVGQEDAKSRVPQRDPATGRFKSADDEREAEMLAERDRPQFPEGAEEAPDGEEKDEPKGKFKFGGVEFDSQEAAEQNFRSLRGVHRSLIERVKSEESEKLYGYKAANAWQAEHDKVSKRVAELEQELASYKSGRGPSGAAAGPVSTDGLAETLQTFEYIARNGTITQAGEFLLTEAAKLAEAKLGEKITQLEQKLSERLMPFESQSEQYQVAENMTRVVVQLSDYKLMDGSLAFPELRDEAKLERIGEIWGELGYPEEHLQTPNGIITAISLLRMYDGMPSGNANPQPVPAPARVAPGAAALSAADSRGLPDRDRSLAGLPPHLQKLSREMGKADNMVDKKLGFARNPRV